MAKDDDEWTTIFQINYWFAWYTSWLAREVTSVITRNLEFRLTSIFSHIAAMSPVLEETGVPNAENHRLTSIHRQS